MRKLHVRFAIALFVVAMLFAGRCWSHPDPGGSTKKPCHEEPTIPCRADGL